METKRKCSKRFDRTPQPNSLRSKVFEFLRDYPHSTLTQNTNYFQEEYRYKIHDLEDFKNMIHVYRCQYWELHGKVYTPKKKDLEAIRRDYDISLFSKDFTPEPEVVIKKELEKENSELERLKSITLALQSRRY